MLQMPHIVPPPRESKLNDRQLAFVDAYMLHNNEPKAKKAAGYIGGAHPLESPKVIEEIRQRQAERSHKTGIDAAWLLVRLGHELDADLADIIDPRTQQYKPVHEWPIIWRQGLISGVETDPHTGTITKVRLSDRVKRLELIGKHVDVKAFSERVEIDISADINISAVDMLTDYIKTINVKPNAMPTIEATKHAAE